VAAATTVRHRIGDHHQLRASTRGDGPQATYRGAALGRQTVGAQHERPPGGSGDRDHGRLVDDAVRGPRDTRQHGGPQDPGENRPPVGDRLPGEVGEAAAGERDEIGVGVGKGDQAAPARHHRQFVQPAGRGLRAGARRPRAVRREDLVALAHRVGRLDQGGVDGQADGLAQRIADRCPLRQRGDEPAEAPVRRERRGQRVVGQQGRLTGHGRQPARLVGERVEHAHRRRGGREVRPDGQLAGPRRQGQHRQQHPDGRQPGQRPALRCAVDVDEQLVHPWRGERQRRPRSPPQRHRDPHRSLLTRGELPGQDGEVRRGTVGARVPGQRRPHLPRRPERGPALHPHLQVVDRLGARVAQRPGEREQRGPVGGDDPRVEPGQVEQQRVVRPGDGHGAGRGAGEEQTGEDQHRGRDEGREPLHALSSNSSVARRISRRSSA
jgi:hypothetical protein